MAKGITCDKCTQGGFQWRRARSGKWVLWDITSNEPHFVGCAGTATPAQVVETAQEINDFAAKVEQGKQLLNEALAPEGLHLVPSLVMPGAYEIEEIQELDQADIDAFSIVKARASFAKMYAAPAVDPKTNTIEAPSGRAFEVQIKPGQTVADALRQNPIKQVARKPDPTQPPQNIPCTKCSVPNRITYADLIAGRSCAHCMND